jgi:hypothetical protein
MCSLNRPNSSHVNIQRVVEVSLPPGVPCISLGYLKLGATRKVDFSSRSEEIAVSDRRLQPPFGGCLQQEGAVSFFGDCSHLVAIREVDFCDPHRAPARSGNVIQRVVEVSFPWALWACAISGGEGGLGFDNIKTRSLDFFAVSIA